MDGITQGAGSRPDFIQAIANVILILMESRAYFTRPIDDRRGTEGKSFKPNPIIHAPLRGAT
jgi:hypothetical protein